MIDPYLRPGVSPTDLSSPHNAHLKCKG
jgi:hypothetical protein